MKMLSPKAQALISAALRHVRDAEHLADERSPCASPDQSYHLAGFGPECARKATLSMRWTDKALGHVLGNFADPLLELALELDPIARRYNPLNWSNRYPALVGWDPQCRYEKTGRRTQKEVDEVVSEARRAVTEIVTALWADGRLDDKGFYDDF